MLLGICLTGGLNSAQAVLTVLGDSGYSTTGTVQATVTAPATLTEMDHHNMYVWQITGLPRTGTSGVPDATWATITFTGIYNWDNNPNRLYTWLFDKAKNAGTTIGTSNGVTSYGNGVTSFVDDPSQSSPDTNIKDDFAITSATGYGKLADSTHGIDLAPNGNTETDGYGADGLSFDGPGQATTYTLVFSGAALTALNSYLNADNIIALGFDSDCHYYDTSITFRMGTGSLNSNLSPVPEATAFFPLIGIVSLAGGAKYLRSRRSKGASPAGTTPEAESTPTTPTVA